MDPYAVVLERIFSLSKGKGMNPSLNNIEKLCEIYKDPQKSYPTIHVAGTNGKGSVCTKIARALQEGGYATGLYTSPHISSFRERIQVGGIWISEAEITSLFQEIQKTVDTWQIPTTFFEMTTMIAFLYFQQKKVDVAVIETGLGGRWDATNVTAPLVSVITSIGYDHTEILGSTLADIASEKAGIIKAKVPVILGPNVPFNIMKQRADATHSALDQSGYKSEDFDRENQATAQLALKTIAPFFPLSDQSIKAGLKAKPPCRFERHFLKKEIIFDVAHNSEGFERLLQMLEHTYPGYAYRFVVGFSRGKDIAECARLIKAEASAVHLVDGPHPRLAKVAEFQNVFVGKTPEIHVEESIQKGILNAVEKPHSTPEVIVIAGSFFIMSEARKAIGLQDIEDPMIWYDPIQPV